MPGATDELETVDAALRPGPEDPSLAGVRESMVAGLFLTTLLSAAAASAQAVQETQALSLEEVAPGEIRGQVHGTWGGARTPLGAALVEVVADGERWTAEADLRGRYAVRGVAAGNATVRVVHAGHEPFEVDVLVPARGVLSLNVDLQRHPVRMAPIEVVADATTPEAERGSPDPDMGLAEVDMRAAADGPGLAEAGVAQVARAIAGDGPGEPTDVLFMRGATTDLKLVLLDGAPVYAPFHVGGLLPTFDANLMGGARHYLGGAPARYDGGLSYILDLSTRAPGRDRVQSTGSADLISARAAIDGPIGTAGGFLVGGRALHPGASEWLSGNTPYGYGDLLARLEVDLAEGHHLSGTGFFNRESVFLDLPGLGAQPGGGDAHWGNRALSLTYRSDRGSTAATARAAFGIYDAQLPISGRSGDLFAFGTSGRGRLTLDLTTPVGPGHLRYGASTDLVETRYEGRQLGGAGGVIVEDAATGTVIGGYAEAAIPLTSHVRLWAGARVDRFSSDGSVRPAPRLRLAWALSDQAVLSIAAGRYHQYARIMEEGVESTLGGVVATAPLGSPSQLLSVATSSHLVVSLDQMLLPTVRVGVDGYVKAFQGVSGPDERMNQSGADLRVQHRGGPLTVWLGYSLAWFWSQRSNSAASDRFAGQQLLSAGVAGRAWDRWGLDLRVGYGDGLPLTAVQLSDGAEAPALTGLEAGGADRGSSRSLPLWPGSGGADQFLRLDAEVSGRFETRFGGRPMHLRPYLKVMNALGRRDALFYYFEPWRGDDLEPLAESTFLPVVGFEWRF